MDGVAFVVSFTVMLLGLIGVLIPLLPGVPLIWLGALLYSLLTGFDGLSWPWLLLFTALTAASVAFDFLASLWITRKMGSSRWGAAGALLGTLLGILFLGAWGALLGGVGGAVLTEFSVQRSWRQAMRSGGGAFIGFLVAMAADLTAGITIVAIFLLVAS